MPLFLELSSPVFELAFCFLARGGLSCKPSLDNVKAGPDKFYLSLDRGYVSPSTARRNSAERTLVCQATGTQRQAKGYPWSRTGHGLPWGTRLQVHLFWILYSWRQGMSYLWRTQALECIPSSLALGASFGGLIRNYESGGKSLFPSYTFLPHTRSSMLFKRLCYVSHDIKYSSKNII